MVLAEVIIPIIPTTKTSKEDEFDPIEDSCHDCYVPQQTELDSMIELQMREVEAIAIIGLLVEHDEQLP